jgi:methylated-DNA-protein-cysteine methyltransferase-like protein
LAASSYQEIYSVVSRIPAGRVATYGQIARLAGKPGHARQVGYALSALDDHGSIPWHRVVNAKGMISSRSGGNFMELVQRLLLENEGVSFHEHGRILLSRYLWRPAPMERRPPGYLHGNDID